MDKVISIIIGIGSYNDIGLIRSCGEAGIKSVYLHDHELSYPINRSKFLLESKSVIPTCDSILDEINRIKRDYNSDLIAVFPASDAAVEIMDNLYDRLPSGVITSHAHGNIQALSDKMTMSQMAESACLITPKTLQIDLDENYKEIDVDFPVILKPVVSAQGCKSDIVVCNSSEQLSDALDLLKTKGYPTILLQQYIHGDDCEEIGITGVSLGNGEILIYGYISKIRNINRVNNFGIYHPQLDCDAIDALKNYIKSTGYIGIFDTDFIKKGDRFYFIECNFRNGAYGYCTTKAGVNMPAAFIYGSLPKNDFREVVFMEERTDLLNVKSHTLPFKKWLKDFIKADTLLWWNVKDPKPTFAYYFGKLKKKVIRK